MLERIRIKIAELMAGVVGAVIVGPAGRLLVQLVRGMENIDNQVLVFGPGCVDWYVLPGTEAIAGNTEDGQPVIIGLQSAQNPAGPPLPGEARFFNPLNGRKLIIDQLGIFKLGGDAATRAAAAVGDTITIAPGAIVVVDEDGKQATNANPVVGTVTTGSPGTKVE